MGTANGGSVRGRGWAAGAVAVVVVLGGGGCAGRGGEQRPGRLRDLLLSAERLPPGYVLRAGAAGLATAGAPGGGAGPGPLVAVDCGEFDTGSFLTRHAPPLEDVAVGLERVPAGGRDRGWSGRESLERYPPGRAGRVLADLRAAALRCAAAGTAVVAGTGSERTVAVEPLGDGLLLRVTRRATGGGGPTWIDRTAVVRSGDVLLVVRESGGEQESAELPVVLGAAVAAYRDAAGE